MMTIDLTADYLNGKLWTNNQLASEIARLVFTRQDRVQFRVQPVKRTLVNGIRSQIEIQDVTNLTMQMGVGPLGSLYAVQVTWTKDEPNNCFIGVLNFNTVPLESTTEGSEGAFVLAPTIKKVSALLHIRFIEDGNPHSIVLPCDIQNAPMITGAPAPDEIEPPENLVTNLALILQDSDDIRVEQVGNTFIFLAKDGARPTWWVTASQAAMLALAARKGDRAIRTDLTPHRMFQLAAQPAATLSNWKLEPVPFNWLDGTWDAEMPYSYGDALAVGVNSVISQQDGNLGNDPADETNIGVGKPWRYLAKGSVLQLSTATPKPVQVGATGNSGSGSKAARDDHEHPAPGVATWTADGFEANEDNKRFDLSEIGFASAQVHEVAASGDWLYLIGDFLTWDNVAANRIIKVDKRGKVDPRWSSGSGFSAMPGSVAVLSDGSLIISSLTAITYRGGAAACLHRLDAFGEVISAFVAPGLGPDPAPRTAVALGTDKIAIVTFSRLTVTDYTGQVLFTEDQGNTLGNNFHRIYSYGSKLLLTSMPYAKYGAVLNPQAVKLLDFTEDPYGAFTGAVDATFAANAGSGWNAMADTAAFAPDGSFAVVGGFRGAWPFTPYAWNNGTPVGKGLLKVYTSGASRGFEVPGWSCEVTTVGLNTIPLVFAVDSQGRVYFGGDVDSVNGASVTPWRLYRVNADGQGLVVFDDFNGVVNDLMVVADDKLLVLGEFTQVGSLPIGYVHLMDDTGRRLHHLLTPDVPIRVGTYREKYVDAAAMVPSVTGGATAVLSETATHKHSRDFYAFPPDSATSVEFDTKLPGEWNRGALMIKLDWFPQTGATPSNGVVFDVQCVASGNGDTEDPAQGTVATLADNVVTVPYHHITPAGQVTPAGTPQKGDTLHWKITRNVDHAGDNAAAAVWLKGLNIQYLEEAVEQTVWT